MLVAMADESGMNENSTFFTMVACIAHHQFWSALKPVWKHTMKKHGIEHFHMWEFAGCRNGFKGWTEDRRRALMRDILAILDGAPVYAIGAAMRVADFDALPQDVREAYVGPYAMCFQELVYGTGLEGLLGFPGEKLDFVYSRQDEFRRHLRGIWDYSQKHRDYGHVLGKLAFLDMRDEPGLQVADIYAWEFRHFFHLKDTRPELPLRYPFKRLLDEQLALNSRRLLYLPQWYLNFQMSDVFEEAMDIVFEHPEAWGHMVVQRYLPGMDPTEGTALMRTLEALKPYGQFPHEAQAERLLRPLPEFVGGYRRNLWPFLVSTNWRSA